MLEIPRDNLSETSANDNSDSVNFSFRNRNYNNGGESELNLAQ